MTHTHITVPVVPVPQPLPPNFDVPADHVQHHVISHGLGSLVGNLIRLPAYAAGAVTALTAGEIAFRGLREIWKVIDTGILGHTHKDPDKSIPRRDWADLTAWEKAHRTIRPFGEMEFPELLQTFAVAMAVSIVVTTAVTFVFGDVPPIYNYALSFLGPIRLESGHWIGVQALIDYFQTQS